MPGSALRFYGGLRANLLCWLALTTALGLLARSPVPLDVGRLAREARELEQRLSLPQRVESSVDFSLPLEARQHLQRTLPRLWRKLSQRIPVQILVLSGEAELAVASPEPLERGDAENFVQRWAAAMARQFYYTGGVRPELPISSALSPAIHLRIVAQAGQSVVDAAAILQAALQQGPLDLVLICHGLGESRAGMRWAQFSPWLDLAIQQLTEQKVEWMLVAPPPSAGQLMERALSQGREMAAGLREVAADHAVPFVDLGDLLGLIAAPQPSAAADAALLFDGFSQRLLSLYHQDESGRTLPKPALHEALAARLWRHWLGQGSDPWLQVESEARFAVAADGRGALSLGLRPLVSLPQSMDLTLLPLLQEGWRALPAPPQHRFLEGKVLALQLPYAPPKQRWRASAAEDQVFCLLAMGSGRAQMLEVRALHQPVALVAQAAAFYNQEEQWRAAVSVINTSDSALQGRWQARLSGIGDGRMGGSLQLPVGGSVPLNLSFDAQRLRPQGGSLGRSGELELQVEVQGVELTQRWKVWLMPNFGLDQTLPLQADDGKPGAVQCRFGANSKELLLDLQLDAQSLPAAGLDDAEAWKISLGIDARSYGKRLEPGSLVPLEFVGTAAEGAGRLAPIAPWAFGNGYAAGFSSAQAKVELLREVNRGARLRCSLPRNWLYLHEWALDNGNSQLGLRLDLTVLTADGLRRWSLLPSAAMARSCMGLAVLELTSKPTSRFACGLE